MRSGLAENTREDERAWLALRRDIFHARLMLEPLKRTHHRALSQERAMGITSLRDEHWMRTFERSAFNPMQPRVPPGNPDGGQWTDGGGGSGDAAIAPQLVSGPSSSTTNDSTRERIVQSALKQIDSQAWSDEAGNGRYPPGSNKCNLFVYDILTAAGASPGLPNGLIHGYPPTAGQWANPSYAIPGWTVLTPSETPSPGDVAAQAIPYSDASGHVMIVGPGNTLVGTGDRGNGPHGTIEQIPMTNDLSGGHVRPSGPVVFRRWRK